jgi:mono/diheme cytochrome c family protein
MRKAACITFLLLAVLFVAASPAAAAGDAAKGKELYLKKCKACHAEDGAGTAPMLKKWGDKLKPLASADVQKKKDDELTKSLKESANHKALTKEASPTDLDNLIAFVRSLKK